MSKLVVFYSRADENYFGGAYRYIEVGNTEKVANMISDITGANKFKIQQVEPYSAKYSVCIDEAKRNLKEKARPEIINMPNNIDDYDEIYLGYPNWWSTMPTTVMTFLESYDFTNKHIYPICSHEGSGMGRSESDLKKLCPNSILHKGLSIHGSHVDGCRQQLERGLGGK